MGKGQGPVDPRWREFSASLRDGNLYLKMPMSKASYLAQTLPTFIALLPETDREFLQQELAEMIKEEVSAAREFSLPSVFCRVPAEMGSRIAAALLPVEKEDLTETVTKFRKVLLAGLNNETDVDWITRMGGPNPKPNDPFFDINLDDLVLPDSSPH